MTYNESFEIEFLLEGLEYVVGGDIDIELIGIEHVLLVQRVDEQSLSADARPLSTSRGESHTTRADHKSLLLVAVKAALHSRQCTIIREIVLVLFFVLAVVIDHVHRSCLGQVLAVEIVQNAVQ